MMVKKEKKKKQRSSKTHDREEKKGFSVQLLSVMVLRRGLSVDVNVHLFTFLRSSARLLLHSEPNTQAGRGQEVGRERDDDSAMFSLKHCLLCNSLTHPFPLPGARMVVDVFWSVELSGLISDPRWQDS